MFCLNVWLTVKDPEDIGAVAGLLAEAVQWSRSEPGCLRFEVFHSEADATKFLLVERWQQKSDWEAHRAGKAFSEIYAPKVLPLVDREPHISRLVE
ncbi:MAG: putative quinol monooxygenase [Planctomycetaceae bacterium]